MSEPFLGEVKMLAFGYAPRGWAMCNGQLMPINQNQALFSLLGTTYGGDGRTNFGLPDLRGRTPVHVGGTFSQGQKGGEEFHTLNQNETPLHTHLVTAIKESGNLSTPTNNFIANGQADFFSAYDPGKADPMNAGTVSTAGASQAHENRSPFLAVQFAIAIIGIFPSRN